MAEPGNAEGAIFGRKLEAGRQIEKADTLDAKILEAVIALKDKVKHGVLSNKLITDEINLQTRYPSSDKSFSYARIRNRLAAMGFEILWVRHFNVLLGGFGGETSTAVAGSGEQRPVKSGSADDADRNRGATIGPDGNRLASGRSATAARPCAANSARFGSSNGSASSPKSTRTS